MILVFDQKIWNTKLIFDLRKVYFPPIATELDTCLVSNKYALFADALNLIHLILSQPVLIELID